MEKYKIREEEADGLASFLVPMLEWYPERRASAKEMLDHPWLNMPPVYEYTMNQTEVDKMVLKSKLGGDEQEAAKEMSELCPSDDDLYGADSEEILENDSEDDSEFFNLVKLNGRVVGKE